MEPWMFGVIAAVCIIALAWLVTKLIRSVDPNDAARLIDESPGSLFEGVTDEKRARIYADEVDDRNEKTWGWRLSALEDRIRKLAESADMTYQLADRASRRATEAIRAASDAAGKATEALNAARSPDVTHLTGLVNNAADKARTALELARTVEESVRTLSEPPSDDIYEPCGRGLVCALPKDHGGHHYRKDGTRLDKVDGRPVDDSVPEQTWTTEDTLREVEAVTGYCRHGRPFKFHEQGGCASLMRTMDDPEPDVRFYCCGGCRASGGKGCEVRASRCRHDNPIEFHNEGGCDA